MKKFGLLLLVCMMVFSLNAAISEVWSVYEGDVDWLSTADTVRGASFNPATGNVIVPSREGGNAVKVLDGANGAVIKDLAVPAGGFSGGAHAISQVKVSRDGIIFVSNLTTDGVGAKVYVWQSEDDEDPAAYVAGDIGNRTGDQAAIAEDEDYIYYITGWDLGTPDLRDFLKYTYDKAAGEIIADEAMPVQYQRRNHSFNYDLENDRIYGTTGWNPEVDMYANVGGVQTFQNNSGSFGGGDSSGSNLYFLKDNTFYPGRYHQLIAAAPMHSGSNFKKVAIYGFFDGLAGSGWSRPATFLAESDAITVDNTNFNYAFELELFELDEDNLGVLLLVASNLVGLYSVPKSTLIELPVEDWSLYSR